MEPEDNQGMCTLSAGLGNTFLCPAWGISTWIMKHKAWPSEHTAKTKLLSIRDKKYTGYSGDVMSVRYITIKVMKRGNSEDSKQNICRCSHTNTGRHGMKMKSASTSPRQPRDTIHATFFSPDKFDIPLI